MAGLELFHRVVGWCPRDGGRHDEAIERVDPWRGEVVGRVPIGDAEAVDAAVSAASSAAEAWAARDPAERAALVRHGASRLAQDVEAVARCNSLEMGKPLGDALGGAHAAVDTARQYAELGPLHRGRSLQGAAEAVDLMRHVPWGVVAVVVPWNDPIAIAVQGVAAALVTGNTVVVKPSERAAFSVDAALAHFDHLPDGVLSVVHGDASTGRRLVADDRVDVVVLTGSVRAGREVAVQTAARGARAVLELGGNDPLIVDAGVEVGWAAEQVALGCFANAGQICVATERVYAHRSVVDDLVAAVVEVAQRWAPGDPFDEHTRMGPLVDRAHRRAVHAHVVDALGRGATAPCGGRVPDGPGAAYPPTVLVDVAPNSAVLDEETFGPVAPIVAVDSWEEAIAHASSGHHGLAATVLTNDAGHLFDARRLRVGTLKLNAVFGGAPGGAAHPRGSSGNALGYGPELLDELSSVQALHLEAPPHS